MAGEVGERTPPRQPSASVHLFDRRTEWTDETVTDSFALIARDIGGLSEFCEYPSSVLSAETYGCRRQRLARSDQANKDGRHEREETGQSQRMQMPPPNSPFLLHAMLSFCTRRAIFTCRAAADFALFFCKMGTVVSRR